MNKSVITEVFCEFRENIRLTEQGRKLMKNIDTAYCDLEKRLTDEQLKLFGAFEDAMHQQHSDELETYFINGFRLGLLIGIECMDG